jgi:uracil phosphoribosyltransferase
MSVTIATHPLVQHKLTVLRNARTSASDFRAVVKELTFYLGYEATRHIATIPEEVITPLGVSFTGSKIGENVAIIPILRAGLGMADAMLDLVPKADVHHIGNND